MSIARWATQKNHQIHSNYKPGKSIRWPPLCPLQRWLSPINTMPDPQLDKKPPFISKLLCFRDLDWFWVTDNLGHLFFTSCSFNSLSYVFTNEEGTEKPKATTFSLIGSKTLDLLSLYPRPDLLCILLNLLVMNLVLFSSFSVVIVEDLLQSE